MSTEKKQIDWSKPVQTKERPPRKVRILTTEAAGDYPVIGNIEGDNMYRTWKMCGRMHHSMLSERDIEPAPTWKLPDPPEGQQWHRVDGWTEEMLPAGYRPLIVGERYVSGDEYWSEARGTFAVETYSGNRVVESLSQHRFYRTTRPLPQQPKQWAAERAAFAAGETIQWRDRVDEEWRDCPCPIWDSTLQYRIKPKQQKVPLEACDVPPLSVFRHKDGADDAWCMPSEVSYYGVTFWSYCPGGGGKHLHRTWRDMMEYVIKRPTDTDWKPCYKEVEL